ERIERLLMVERSWPLPAWRERYLDHPLLSQICRRLILEFERGERTGLGIWHEGAIVDQSGLPLDWLDGETRVRLWHPIRSSPETVVRWRRRLEELEVAQPFKQAHREVYVLTDAELETRSYSNRFAAHILRQHQFNALCQQKGWSYRFQGLFDSSADNRASLALPEYGMRADRWVDPVDEAVAGTSYAGVLLYVTTDQVRFCDPQGQPRPLAEVPALLFSEVMRQVDLFVGVASIGNDPAWQDRGADE